MFYCCYCPLFAYFHSLVSIHAIIDNTHILDSWAIDMLLFLVGYYVFAEVDPTVSTSAAIGAVYYCTINVDVMIFFSCCSTF